MELARPLQQILLVDDNPNDRLLAIREISREFPEVKIQEALNWDELHQQIDADNFDLVITDYELHWATGVEVLNAIKASDPTRPIIMFTDSGTQEIAVEAMKAGLDDYVLKSPRHLVRLSQAVRSTWKNAQMQRRASKLQLQLKFLLNELQVGVFRTTLEGELLEASDGLLQLLGLRSFAEAQTFFRETLAFGAVDQTQRRQRHREIQLRRSGRPTLWVKISETSAHSNGRPVIDGLIIDITRQKKTAFELQALNQTLEKRVEERTALLAALNKELTLFAFSVSHDLRSPIRQIDGFVTFLQQELQSVTTNATILHYLHQINQLTQRSGRMIDELLTFSRTGRVEMGHGTVDMNRLVQETRQQMSLEFSQRVIHWQVEPLPTISGDYNLLRQVWQNLIENAVKYTVSRPQAEIVVGSQIEELEVIFYVRDNGIGFDMKEVKRLFGIFQRLSNAADFDGTGIGLANVQRIIHRHGGRIWGEGELDRGATFYFALPLAKRTSA